MPAWVAGVPFIGLHLALLTVFFVPVTTLGLVLFAVTYSLRVFGLTAGYHRYFGHRAFKTSRVFQFVLAWLGASALQKELRKRKHYEKPCEVRRRAELRKQSAIRKAKLQARPGQ